MAASSWCVVGSIVGSIEVVGSLNDNAPTEVGACQGITPLLMVRAFDYAQLVLIALPCRTLVQLIGQAP
jgi:hypothetical protein